MPNHDAAIGVVYEHEPSHGTKSSNHWLFDPSQLIHWQGELVSSCEAINDQLTQIQRELSMDPVQTLRIFGCSASVSK